MRLNQFQFLVALKRFGSFSAAAQNLYVSQPTISNAIKELEEELNCKLLERSNKGVSFSAKGTQVLESAEAIMNLVDNIHRIVDQDNSLEQLLRVGATPHLCNTLIWRVISSEMENHKKPKVQVCEDSGSVLLQRVCNGEIDLAVVQTSYIRPADLRAAQKIGAVIKDLFTDTLVLCCRPGHPLLSLDIVTPADVAKYPFVSYFNKLEADVEAMLNGQRYEQPIIQINEVLSLRKYICSTDAVTSMPLTALINGNQNFKYQLAPLRVAETHWSLPVCLVHMGETLTEAQQIFVNQLLVESDVICKEFLRQ